MAPADQFVPAPPHLAALGEHTGNLLFLLVLLLIGIGVFIWWMRRQV